MATRTTSSWAPPSPSKTSCSLYAWCRDRGQAEQFVQDTFERLLRIWSRLDSNRNRVGYARRTLVNLMISDHHLDAMGYTATEAARAVYDVMVMPPAPADFPAWLDQIRAAVTEPAEPAT
jgi:DNA-directed RNA polymerase specialized sigma24 family protein